MDSDKNLKGFSFKITKNEKKEIVDWIKAQSNLTEAIRYLMEKEIFENGTRNLAKFIPIERDAQFFKNISNQSLDKNYNFIDNSFSKETNIKEFSDKSNTNTDEDNTSELLNLYK